MDDALLCLEQGKAVLCEKPFTVNAREARRVVEVARKKRLFCMEAMWMRFIPAVQRARELVRAGAIGEPRLFTGSFCVANAYDPKSRFFDPALGGGALLDRGVYPLSLATFLFGMPERITGQAGLAPTGVDEHSTLLMQFSGGRLAQFASSLSHTTRNEATIAGTHGRLLIHEPIYCPQQLTLTRYAPATVTAARAPGLMQRVAGLARGNALVRGVYGGLRATLRRSEQSFKLPITGNGYNYEAAEVMRCLRAGELESPLMPLDESVRIMELMDEVRGQFGVRYPGE
jgi:predicted dehydrogenase